MDVLAGSDCFNVPNGRGRGDRSARHHSNYLWNQASPLRRNRGGGALGVVIRPMREQAVCIGRYYVESKRHR